MTNSNSATFVGVAELAEMLNLPARTIQYLAKEGRLPGAFRLCRQWQFDVKSVLDRIEQLKAETTSAASERKASVERHKARPIAVPRHATYDPIEMERRFAELLVTKSNRGPRKSR